MSEAPIQQISEARRAKVAAAIEIWRQQLLDLTGRNRLLYYRHLKSGTLSLDRADIHAFHRLKDGQKVRLTTLFPEPSPADFQPHLRRARTIWAKAREHMEERGVETLFLALGMATWTSERGSATPNAPVFLNTLSLTPVNAARTDFHLHVSGEWHINPTLLQAFATEFGVHVEPEPIVTAFEDSGLNVDFGARMFERQATQVPGLTIGDEAVVGTFVYNKLAMVQDLENSLDHLASNDIIAAIAGDTEARRDLTERRGEIDLSLPDVVAFHDEFLILDADSSQSRVINAVLDGRSVVVQGPPGTGKSQTIANLIAALAARGKRTLFVAEKRAAIEAVVKRLEQVGLGELVMDIHGGAAPKREVARRLAESLEVMQRTPLTDLRELEHVWTTSRQRLAEHATKLHTRQEPWNMSMWDVQAGLLGIDASLDTGVRLIGSVLQDLDADRRLEIRDQLREWAVRTRAVRSDASPWAGASVPTRHEAETIAELIGETAHTTGPALVGDLDEILARTGITPPATFEGWVDVLATLRELDAVAEVVTDDAWVADHPALSDALAAGQKGGLARMWAQLTSSPYRAAKLEVRGWQHTDTKLGGRDALALVDRVRAVLDDLAKHDASQPPRRSPRVDTASAHHATLIERLAALGAYAVMGIEQHHPVARITDRFRALDADRVTLQELPRIHELEQHLTDAGLGPFLDAVGKTQWDAEAVLDAFELCWLESLHRQFAMRHPDLATFNGRYHDDLVHQWRATDTRHLEVTPDRVRRAVAEGMVEAVNAHREQAVAIRAEAGKKSRHLPLRTLLARAPDVLLRLRPCWVMSPLIVSEMLPAQELFDVVIFDEASQVLPSDAIPALGRARQVVMAGDRHQLPPTTFFDGSSDDLEDDEDDESITRGYESILDVCSSILDETMLTWHYRSQDEKLISFSNHQVYGGGLTTFPGVGHLETIAHVRVQSGSTTATDTRSNTDEVHRVVDLMLDHARSRPDESLGVIALGIHHANRIEALLYERLGEERDPDLDRFFADDRFDAAFVKNLERVQGDERDAIILTVGYGPDANGRLAMRFGPINQEGGYRRLNVAVTRARKRMTVVSSFAHHEVDLQRTAARGVAMLRGYLEFAASGGAGASFGSVEHPLNPFELSVRDRLEREGLILEPQFGVSGFRIDFAVCHPEDPGRMVLAVETDGASYHSTPTARDRDRLRQQMLERLGWRFHRIWSTDWFNDQNVEVERLLDSYHRALNGAAVEPARAVHTPTRPDTAPVTRAPRPDIPRRGSIDAYTQIELVSLVRWIRSDTLLRSNDDIIAEATRELGFTRRGSKIVAAITRAIDEADRMRV